MKKIENRLMDDSTRVIIKVIIACLGLWIIYSIRDVLLLFFVAVIIMAAINPLVTWFNGKVKIPRPVGVLIIYLLLLSVLGLIVSFLVPTLSQQFKNFVGDLPRHLQEMDAFLTNLSFQGQSYGFGFNLDKLADGLSTFSFNLFSTTLGFFNGIISFIIILSMAFYMSVKEDGMEKFLESVTPNKYREVILKIAQKIKNRIGRWMSGQLILMLIVFALDYAVLYFLGVPYALIIALIGGFLEIVPYIGPIISTLVAVVITVLISPLKAVFVFIFYVAIQQAENNIIFPQIMKKAVGLNPLTVILAMLIGFKLGGILGTILAVPVATSIGVIFKELTRTNKVS